jgi:hypothetical protein
MFVNCFWILAILSICKNCQLAPLVFLCFWHLKSVLGLWLWNFRG